ncbi:uncharacterized protein LOC115314722 isoform X2 [Ixodes scapularis]|uniref:uncharacterized protein LOC115314722 isoform X2 n=1 Tax=Ixodes scapularis TaxID=6945 RepID=UPI001A9DBD94|nr:uncharacterized protein LOC115314722 isoform X2 [Ixodes scapularis]
MDTKAVRRLHWRRCALKTVKPPKERACQMKLLQMTPLQMYHWPSCSDDDGNTFIFPKLGALHDTIISGKPLTSSSFRKIVELLFRAMVNITVWSCSLGMFPAWTPGFHVTARKSQSKEPQTERDPPAVPALGGWGREETKKSRLAVLPPASSLYVDLRSTAYLASAWSKAHIGASAQRPGL